MMKTTATIILAITGTLLYQETAKAQIEIQPSEKKKVELKVYPMSYITMRRSVRLGIEIPLQNEKGFENNIGFIYDDVSNASAPLDKSKINFMLQSELKFYKNEHQRYHAIQLFVREMHLNGSQNSFTSAGKIDPNIPPHKYKVFRNEVAAIFKWGNKLAYKNLRLEAFYGIGLKLLTTDSPIREGGVPIVPPFFDTADSAENINQVVITATAGVSVGYQF